jgi:PAS domain S-box-containing protein
MAAPHEPHDDPIELRRERDLLRALLDSTPTFFVIIGADGRTRLMNRAMLDALGYEEDEVIGTDYMETFVPKQDREGLADVFERIIKLRQRTLNENRVITREGDLILVEWHGTPVFDEKGDLEFFFGVGTDITEDRRRDLRIAEWEARYRALAAHGCHAVILADAYGKVVDADERAAGFLGYRAHEMLRLAAADLGLPKEGEYVEVALRHRDGSEVPSTVTVVTFTSEDGAYRLHLMETSPAAAGGD